MWTAGTVDFRVQIGLSGEASGARWDSALWDSDNWSGAEPTFTDLPDVLSVNIAYGRDRFLDVPRAANCSVSVSNTDGALNPSVGDGIGDNLILRPGRLLRVQASYQSGWQTLFRGYIWSIGEDYGQGGDNPVSQFNCVGFLSAMAGYRPPAVPAVGAGDLTSDRILRVLELWPRTIADLSLIQVGDHTMPASDLGSGMIALAQQAAAAEGSGSGFYFSPDGRPVFKAREWLQSDPRSVNVQMSPGSGVPGQPEVIDAIPSWSVGVIVNDVQLTRPDGVAPVRVQSSISQGLYGPRTFQDQVMVDNDADLMECAEGTLEGNEYDRLRLDSITLFASDREQARRMLETELGDLVRPTVTTLQGWGYTAETHVAGIGYTITPSDWSLRLRLDDTATGVPPGLRGGFDAAAFDEGFFIGT